MGKIQQFKDAPEPNAYGQYYYESDSSEFEDISLSNSVLTPYDKFSDKTLHTTVVSDPDRDYIVGNKLPMVGLSNIKIKKLVINNAGVHHKVKNTHFRAFVFDKNTFDCFESGETTIDGEGNEVNLQDGETLKSYEDIHNALYTNIHNGADDDWTDGANRLSKYTMFMDYDAPSYNKKRGPGELTFLTDQTILEDLSTAEDPSENLSVPEYSYRGTLFDGVANMDGGTYGTSTTRYNQPFNPMDGLATFTERTTSILNEGGDNNYIQFVIWTKGDAKRFWNTKRRKQRLYVFKVDLNELINTSTSPATGLSKVINFTDFKRRQGGGGTTPAFVVSEFSVEINVAGGAPRDDYINSGYNPDILDNITYRKVLNNNNFDLDFSEMGPTHEPFTLNASNNSSTFRMKNDFTPTAKVTIRNRLFQNLQSFKTDTVDRQICSAPTTIKLKINTSDVIGEDTILEETNALIENNHPPFYKFCVLNWNDVNDEFQTVEDIFNKKPTTFNDIIKNQSDNNTFIFGEKNDALYNNYKTPGIKKIKVFVASYIPYNYGMNFAFENDYSQTPPFASIELLRFKLMTVRIFLDIPVSEFPDFGEVGGSDFSTIPWPNTVPIIGGINENSKYFQSVNDILGGGKIGSQDIIDESFLENAKINDQLGVGIDNYDLEQTRYFNKPYDMNQLLLPEENIVNVNYINEDPEWLATLPFPQYQEEFDIDNTGEVTIIDSSRWTRHPLFTNGAGRPDIGEWIAVKVIGITGNPATWTYPEEYSSYGITGWDHPSHPRGLVYNVETDELLPYGNGSEMPNSHFINPDYHQGNFLSYNTLVSTGESENKIDDVNFKDIIIGSQGEKNGKWMGDINYFPDPNVHPPEAPIDGDIIGDVIYTPKTYSDGTHGINIRYEVSSISNTYIDGRPIFRYHRADIGDLLKPFMDGGTQYNFKYEIKFNEWTENAPQHFFVTAGNTLDDIQGDSTGEQFMMVIDDGGVESFTNDELGIINGFPPEGKIYHRQQDGIYQLTNDVGTKVADFGVWINSNISRNIVSNYETQQSLAYQTTTSFPTLEFSTTRWFNSFYVGPGLSSAVIDFDIRNPVMVQSDVLEPFWNGSSTGRTFSEETSVGQIFINDNSDENLKKSCTLEFNTGNLTGKTIYDSSGNSNKGLLIGDYKIKKTRKGEPMRRDSFIKVPKKTNNSNGAL